MSEEDWKDLGIIKNKWVETKDDCLDMALNIFDKVYQENKELKERIDNTMSFLENDLKSFIYSIEYKTLMKLLRGDK